MTRACHLLLLLLFAVKFAFGVHTPPSSPPQSPITSSTSKRAARHRPRYYGRPGLQSGVRQISSYTITEPARNGKSLSSEEHPGKLFVDPVLHEPMSEARTRESERINHLYFGARSIDQNNYKEQMDRHAVGPFALEKIASGHVVRHTNEEETVLLHRKTLPAERARIHHEHDFAYDLTRSSDGYQLQPTAAKKQFEQTHQVPVPLDEMQKAEMHERLAKHQQDARKQVQVDNSTEKLYWNPRKRIAEQDKGKEEQLTALQRFRESNQAKKAAEAAAAASSSRLKRARLSTSTASLNRSRKRNKEEGSVVHTI